MHKPATGARPQDCPAMTCANFKKHQLVKSVRLSKDPTTYWNEKLVLENSQVFLGAFENLNSISINTIPIPINIHIILWVRPVLITGSSRTLWKVTRPWTHGPFKTPCRSLRGFTSAGLATIGGVPHHTSGWRLSESARRCESFFKQSPKLPSN